MIGFGSLIGGLILGGVGWFIYKTYIWEYYVSPLRKIPGPPSGNLLFGNLKALLTEETDEIHIGWVKKYGNLVRYHGWLNRTFVLVADPKMVQAIVSQAYDYPKPERFVASARAFIGYGLALVDGDIHKRQRKMMTPAFTHSNIKDMTPTFNRVALTLKNLIEEKVNKGESKLILTSHISNAALDIIGLVGFNHEFNTLTSPSELAEAYASLLGGKQESLRVAISILSGYVPLLRKIPIAVNKRFHHSCKIIERETKKLIENKYNDKNHGNDLLSLLFKINQTLPIEEKMTDDELGDQIMTFLLAGHETTSTSVCWILHLLARHPHEQDLLREELVKAFPDKSKINPTFDEINSLEYLNCIVKEILRLYPPVTNVERTNAENKVIDGHFFPKDTSFVISMSALHRLPSVWGPTADKFDPKRWLDPSLIKDVNNFNYLPFNTGVRSCIGNKIALNEIKILTSFLVRNFVFQPVEGLHIRKTSGALSKPRPYLELMVSKVES